MFFISISASAFKKYLSHIPIDTTEFCDVIYVALEQTIKTKDSTVFKNHIAEFTEKMGPKMFHLCLQATKDFLNSRDCQYPGKYQYKSFFFGGITLVSSSPFLRSINAELDTHIASLPQAYSCSTIWSSAYQLLKSNVKTLTSRPAALITAILSCQVQITHAANAKATNAVGLDQCPAILPTTSFLQQVPQFIPYEYAVHDIPSFYRVYQNTDTPLDQVKLFLFGELHNNDTHHSLKRYFISLLGKPGDYVLFEAHPMSKVFPCKQKNFSTKFICSGWEADRLYKQVYNQVYRNIHVQTQSSENVKTFGRFFNNAVDSFNKLQEIKFQLIAEVKILIELNRAYLAERQKWVDALSDEGNEGNITNITENINLLDNKITSNHKLRDRYETTISTIANIAGKKLAEQRVISDAADREFANEKRASQAIKSVRPKVVKERNAQGLLVSLSFLRNRKIRIFVVGGIAHFASDRAWQGDDLSVLDENDDQYELREAISKEAYAIFYPR